MGILETILVVPVSANLDIWLMATDWQHVDYLLILCERMDSNTLDELKRETVLNQKLGLLAFLTVRPLSCLDGLPINFIELRQVRAIFKVVRTCV
jgi:hypothetical protein